jgi:hypothetical protein
MIALCRALVFALFATQPCQECGPCTARGGGQAIIERGECSEDSGYYRRGKFRRSLVRLSEDT